MKLTVEMLEKFYPSEACQDSIDFIKKNYPDGAELLEILKNPELPRKWVHDARRLFPLTVEEVDAYNNFFNIKNCVRTLYSENVLNSEVVLKSENVEESTYVVRSEQVKSSDFIYDSKRVELSGNILRSEGVLDSQNIIDSKDVVESNDVVNSNIVTWSNNVIDSLLIKNSEFICKSTNLLDCYFCSFMNHSKHCLFCAGLEDAEYYIFNKQVGRADYERIKAELLSILGLEQSTFITINESVLVLHGRFIHNGRLDSVFDGLSEEFYAWLKTVPNYTEDAFLQVFLTNKNLKNS